MGFVLGGIILIWAFYVVFASIFKHKAGLCITAILFLLLGIITLIYAKNVSILIEIVIFVPCIMLIPRLQVKNNKKSSSKQRSNIEEKHKKEFIAEIEEYNENIIVCKNCGYQIFEDETKCSNCGEKK